MKFGKFILLILLTFSALFSGAQNMELFEEANDLYNDGKFAEAIEKYEEILDNGEHSADLYFNLGNAHYKLNNVAPSIYFYEKALQLNPKDKDIKNNIAFARNMTIDDIGSQPEVGFRKILNNTANIFTFENWAKLSVSFVILFVITFLLYYFSFSTIRKRIFFVSSSVLVVIICLSLFMAFHTKNIVKNDNPAIVFVQESQVKSEPNLRGTIAFTLHEGTKIQIMEMVDDWKKIRIADGRTGWIPDEDIKPLK